MCNCKKYVQQGNLENALVAYSEIFYNDVSLNEYEDAWHEKGKMLVGHLQYLLCSNRILVSAIIAKRNL